MRDVDEVALQTLENGAEIEIALGAGAIVEERDGLKTLVQRADFCDFLWRADQEILIGMVKPAESADDIASIGADTELGHAPNVDGYLHGVI